MPILADSSVLLVDDEFDFLELVEFEFRKCGSRTYIASGAKEAFEVFSAEAVDLIVSDIRMNDGDGIELLKRIKMLDLHRPPIMLVSGVEDIGPRAAYSLGAEALFQKPCKLSELLETARRLLLPPLERWSRQDVARPKPNISVSTTSNNVDFGRGGLSFMLSAPNARVSSTLKFDVKCDLLELENVEGIGTIRWVETDSLTRQVLCGLEIDYLIDTWRQAFVDWIHSKRIVPYIPRGLCSSHEIQNQPWRRSLRF